MINVINFIKENSNWREILSNDPYNLTIKDDGDFTILKYSQINSDFSNDIVRECRGLIIKESEVVCMGFKKFGNYGESYADIIDWDTAKVEEKIDGSLIKVWNYKNEWHVSTNGTIFAENAKIGNDDEIQINNKYNNFLELFNAALDICKLDIEILNPQYTYMFELISPYNRVVVPYKSIDIYHIGTRDNISMKEIEVDIGVKKPQTYNCNKLEDLIEMASKLKYCEEGYVVKDNKYKRIKVKSPAYVAIHRLVGGINDKRLLELLRINESNEFLNYFPEYKQNINELSSKIDDMVFYIEKILRDKINEIKFKTKKDFALVVTKTKYPAFFFSYYDGKFKNPIDWIWSMTNDKILEQLGKLRGRNNNE